MRVVSVERFFFLFFLFCLVSDSNQDISKQASKASAVGREGLVFFISFGSNSNSNSNSFTRPSGQLIIMAALYMLLCVCRLCFLPPFP